MSNNKQILPKKHLNPHIVKNIFDNSSFVIIATHSGFTVNEFNLLNQSTSELGLKVKHVKNKPLKKTLENSKYKSFISLFQGNTILFYSVDDDIDKVKVFNYLSKNKKILMTGLLIDNLFLSTTMMKPFMKNSSNKMSEFCSLLKYSSNSLVNQSLSGKIPSLFSSLNHIKSAK
jgi:ribosomal protein L10